jgi:LPXTG-motif cell wall-anchored protein
LMSNTQYTLLLSAIDGLTAVNSPNNAQLYWSYYATTPATGQPYTLNNSGYVAGAYTGANPFTQQNLAFDINTQSAPEPGTLLLGLIASSAGGGMVWWKRRKKSQAPPADGPEELTPV